jgi:hypothetical protein
LIIGAFSVFEIREILFANKIFNNKKGNKHLNTIGYGVFSFVFRAMLQHQRAPNACTGG